MKKTITGWMSQDFTKGQAKDGFTFAQEKLNDHMVPVTITYGEGKPDAQYPLCESVGLTPHGVSNVCSENEYLCASYVEAYLAGHPAYKQRKPATKTVWEYIYCTTEGTWHQCSGLMTESQAESYFRSYAGYKKLRSFEVPE